jgi:hypothetical protein
VAKVVWVISSGMNYKIGILIENALYLTIIN